MFLLWYYKQMNLKNDSRLLFYLISKSLQDFTSYSGLYQWDLGANKKWAKPKEKYL